MLIKYIFFIKLTYYPNELILFIGIYWDFSVISADIIFDIYSPQTYTVYEYSYRGLKNVYIAFSWKYPSYPPYKALQYPNWKNVFTMD